MFSKTTVHIDWKSIPYERYWDQIESFYQKPDLNETRTVRVFTTNYCPFDCVFCSSTNFLNAAGGSKDKKRAKVAGLTPEQIMEMLKEVLEAHPTTRNIFINNGTKKFLLKYGFNPRFFRKYYLQGDRKNIYEGPLNNPKFTFNMIIDLLINKLKFYYYKLLQ